MVASAALSHPGIVTIHSIEESAGIHFLTMELVDGQALSAVIPADGMPSPRLVELAVPLADAIAAAHVRAREQNLQSSSRCRILP